MNGAGVKIPQSMLFKNYKTFDALNSFYDEDFYKFKDKQIIDLKSYINNWKNKRILF